MLTCFCFQLHQSHDALLVVRHELLVLPVRAEIVVPYHQELCVLDAKQHPGSDAVLSEIRLELSDRGVNSLAELIVFLQSFLHLIPDGCTCAGWK